jgi:hypothetical protein
MEQPYYCNWADAFEELRATGTETIPGAVPLLPAVLRFVVAWQIAMISLKFDNFRSYPPQLSRNL